MAEKKINGRTYRTEPLLATAALVLQARLLKTLSPALSRLGDIFQGMGAKDEAKAEASNAAAIGALTEIFANAEPQAIAQLIKDITEIAVIQRPSGEYHSIDFDADFQGRLGDIFPVVAFVLREQFGDFFSAMPGSGNLGRMMQG